MAVAREGNVGNDIEMVGLQFLHVSQAELAIVTACAESHDVLPLCVIFLSFSRLCLVCYLFNQIQCTDTTTGQLSLDTVLSS
jgi:hypothetical protein